MEIRFVIQELEERFELAAALFALEDDSQYTPSECMCSSGCATDCSGQGSIL